MANNSGFSEKEKITISGSQSVRSTKVPVVPFLEQHSRKIQIRLQHMNLKSAQVNIKNKRLKKKYILDSMTPVSILLSFSPPASLLPASDIFSYFLRLAILEKNLHCRLPSSRLPRLLKSHFVNLSWS